MMMKRSITDLPLESIEVAGEDAAARPLVVTLHGRGADMFDLADLAPAIDPEGRYRFLFPNAPRAFEPMPGYSFGRSWFDGWPPEGSSLQESREALMRFLDEAQQRYGNDDPSTLLAGFSQGGLMALDTGFRRKSKLAGIVVMSGALHEKDMPDFAGRKDQKLLIVHGMADEVIPLVAPRRARLVLREAGIEPEYHEFPMGHHTSPESIAVVKNFIDRALSINAER